MSVDPTPAYVLRQAADLIELPGVWCQNSRAMNNFGQSVHPLDNGACRWCATGAISVLWHGRQTQEEAFEFLSLVVGPGKWLAEDVVMEWNDSPGRTQGQVVAALRTAAERYEATIQRGLDYEEEN